VVLEALERAALLWLWLLAVGAGPALEEAISGLLSINLPLAP